MICIDEADRVMAVDLRGAWERTRRGEGTMDELVSLQHLITERMEAGASLDEMEREIEKSALDEEEKSALWLYAWSYLPGTAQRQGAGAAAAKLAETYDGPSAPQGTSVRRLSDVMGAVREHEGQTGGIRRRRYEDDRLYRRVREALGD